MPVFLNFRVDDGDGWASFLDDRLMREFGSAAVFRSSRSIRPAANFEAALLTAVRSSSVVVAVIGSRWKNMPGQDGRTRLEHPDDWVRRELAEAFTYGIPVLPVLVGRAEPLTPDGLPVDIAPIARCQFLRLGHRTVNTDTALIVAALRDLDPALGRAAPDDLPAPRAGLARVAPSGRLTQVERRELLEAFYAIDSLWNRLQRQAYIDEAEAALGRPVPFPRHSRDGDDIDELVTAWLDHVGALHVLVSVLLRDSPGSPDAARLQRAVAILAPAPVLTGAERRKMDRTTRGVDLTTAIRAFDDAFGNTPPPLRREPTGLPMLLAELEDIACPPGQVPPLLRYLEQLAAAGAPLVAIALRELVDEISDRLGLKSGNIERLRRQVRGEGEAVFTFLKIQLQPDGASDHHYLVSASIHRGSDLRRPVGQPEAPLTIAQVEKYVDRLLTEEPEIARHLGEDDLWVEFVLPQALINADVDQWTFGCRINFPLALGTYYRVTVRSLERQQQPHLQAALQTRCRKLPPWTDARFEDAVHWLPDPRPAGDTTLLAELLLQPATACMAFGFPPGTRLDPGPDEYAAGLVAGIPVMVWERDTRDPDAFRSVVKDLVDVGGVAGIPGHIRRLRREAAATGTAARMTVLYEPAAPRRAYKFQAPA